MNSSSGLYRMQISRLLTRRSCKIAFAFSMAFVTVAYVEECINLWQADHSMLYSAASGWIGNINALRGNVMQVFYLFGICFVAALSFSDTFLEDQENHSINAILGRNSWKSYWRSGLILSFVGGFFVILIPLLISQLLSFILFPAAAGVLEANVGTGIWEFPTLLTNDAFIFPWLTVNQTYLSNLVFIISSSLFAGSNATISYLLSLFGMHKKLLVLGTPSLFWIIYNVVILYINSKLVYQIYLYPNYSIFKEPWFFFVLPLSLILIILAGCLIVQRRKKEAVLL